MRLTTARLRDGRTRVAREEGDQLVLLPWPDLGALLAAREEGAGDADWRVRAAAYDGERISAAAAGRATLVPHPNKIICVGLNYRTHILEMGRPTPEYPTLFAKYDGALIGAYDPIVMPAISEDLDWEAELGVVIGRPGRHLTRDSALDHVGGYTVVNDVTVRDWQHRTREFLSGKTFEATNPVGPVLVTPDELPAGGRGLDLGCSVDGDVMQKSNTADLLFDVADLVAYASTIITLRPGDLILTGTPGGVGAGRDPKVFLRPGQELVTWVEGIGELRNRVVREQPVSPAGPASR